MGDVKTFLCGMLDSQRHNGIFVDCMKHSISLRAFFSLSVAALTHFGGLGSEQSKSVHLDLVRGVVKTG